MQDSIFHQTSWAVTTRGTDIELYKKVHTSNDFLAQKPILFIGGVHGDEPEGVRLAQDLLSWLQQNKQKTHPWILIPNINPDGFAQNQRTNANAVDLNRNFPARDWSSEAKAERYFPGPKPASEIETQSLVQLIEDEKPQLIVHFHSWEPCVVYTGMPGKKAAMVIGSGTPFVVREEIGYPTPGSLGQYAWLEKNIPVICVEAPEKSELDSLWPLFGAGLIKLLTSDEWTK